MMHLARIVTVATLFVAAEVAAETNGPTGAGSASCSEFLVNRPTLADHDVHAQWASGLIVGRLSAAHHYIPEQLTVGEVADRLRVQCLKNPNQSVLLAALNIAAEYQAQK